MKFNLIDKWRRAKRKVYGTLCFSTALFVFQACYGSRYDSYPEVVVQGTIVAKKTNLPKAGIKVGMPSSSYGSTLTDADGKFTLYSSKSSEYKLHIEVSSQNGQLITQDTVFKSDKDSVKLALVIDVE